MLHLLIDWVPQLSFPSWLPMQEVTCLSSTHKSLREIMKDIKPCIGFMRGLQIRHQGLFSAQMWNDVRADCEAASTLEGWHVDVWQRSCLRLFKGVPYRLPETFYLLIDRLVYNHSCAMLPYAVRRSDNTLPQPADSCVAVLAFQCNIRHPGPHDDDDFHGRFFVQCLCVMASTRVIIFGAYAAEDGPWPFSEDILYNIVVGDSVQSVIQTAKELVAQHRDPPPDGMAAWPAGDRMPWDLIDGHVSILFCDQDLRLPYTEVHAYTGDAMIANLRLPYTEVHAYTGDAMIANPFKVCNVERFRTLMTLIEDNSQMIYDRNHALVW